MEKTYHIFYALILIPLALVLSGCASGRRTATVHDEDTRSGSRVQAEYHEDERSDINGTETDRQIDDSDQLLFDEVRAAESGARKIPVPPEQISIEEQAEAWIPDFDIEPAPLEPDALATADPELSRPEPLDISVPEFEIKAAPAEPDVPAPDDPRLSIAEPVDVPVPDIDIEPAPLEPDAFATADPELALPEPADVWIPDFDIEPAPLEPDAFATADPELALPEQADVWIPEFEIEPAPAAPDVPAPDDPRLSIAEPADVPDIEIEPAPTAPAVPAAADPRLSIAEPADVPVPDIDIDVEPAPMAPAALAAADPNIRESPPASALTVQPEAVLRIRVKEDPTLDGQYAVNQIGAVNLGYIGPIILFNYTEQQAAEKISEVLVTRAFRNATVEVEILRASYDRIGIGGQVNNAGLLRIGAGDSISLNDALLRAGGLSAPAHGMQVRIVRGGLTNVLASSQEGELYAMQDANGRPAVPRVWLRNNDKAIVFSIHARGAAAAAEYGDKEVIVLGEVSRPGPIRFAHGESATMMRLAFKIGGFPRYANTRQVRILRRDEQGIEHEIRVNVERMLETGDPEKDVPLQDGDRIIVPARRISLF